MRIAYICSDFGVPVHGSKGAAIHVREMSRALKALGHEVLIVAARAGGEPPAGFDVPVIEIVPDGLERQIVDLLRADPGAGEVVAKEVRALLHATAMRYRSLPQLMDFAPDVIYERFALFGSAGMALAQDLGVPRILEVNAPLSEEQAALRGLAFVGTARGLEQAVLRSADHVIAVSQPLAGWLGEAGVDGARVSVLPNGVDPERLAAGAKERASVRAALGIAPGRPVVGFVGTLKAWHGTESLLRAVARLLGDARDETSAPHLLIVGEGPERPALEALASDLGISAATAFTGAVPHEAVPGYLAAMDIAVAPSSERTDFYFSPLKLFEYMAAGRPVVAADIGQIRDCVRHGETGLLYPPGDVVGLADALAVLIDDSQLAATIGRAGQEDVQAHHTWEGNARAVAAVTSALPGPAGKER